MKLKVTVQKGKIKGRFILEAACLSSAERRVKRVFTNYHITIARG
jgi:hypothetical protein